MINPGQAAERWLHFSFLLPGAALVRRTLRSRLLSGKAEDVRPGEQKAPGRIYCSLPGPAGATEGLLMRAWSA